jgi:hypothetical protein
MASITHFASLLIGTEEVFGTAELLNGSGYLFRKDGERTATVVSYKDPDLMLYGVCTLADAQYLDDEIHGGPVGVCLSRAQEVR